MPVTPRSRRLPTAPLYPKPGPTGGRLIRQVVGLLKNHQFELPFTSHILIAVSGGPDSIALAHLLLKYGRRVVDHDRLILLHVNHGWREGAAKDARFVKAFAKKWKVRLLTRDLKGPDQNAAYQGKSWEETARTARKAFFQEMADHYRAPVLTAHQADDLAETLLWRLFTGAALTHGGGIAVRHGQEIRPLLKTRKSELFAYLKEEGQKFVEDPTNSEGRFLRSRLRTEIIPPIEKLFPRAIEHLVKQGFDAQSNRAHIKETGGLAISDEAPALLFQAAGIKDRRSHWEAILRGQSEIHLPGGWKLTRETRRSGKRPEAQQVTERWLLERKSELVS